jgi:hypothetical protein
VAEGVGDGGVGAGRWVGRAVWREVRCGRAVLARGVGLDVRVAGGGGVSMLLLAGGSARCESPLLLLAQPAASSTVSSNAGSANGRDTAFTLPRAPRRRMHPWQPHSSVSYCESTDLASGRADQRRATVQPGGQPDMQQLMQQAQKMQEQLFSAQQELAEAEVTGTAGGGLVTAVMTGSGELTSVSIDPKVVDPDDIESLQDLVVAAVRDANRACTELAQDKMGPLAGGLGGGGIPGLPF